MGVSKRDQVVRGEQCLNFLLCPTTTSVVHMSQAQRLVHVLFHVPEGTLTRLLRS